MLHNKRSILMLKINGETFSWKRFAFLQQLVFFPECFQLKYSRNLLESKYDLTMVTFNLWIDRRHISAAPNSYRD